MHNGTARIYDGYVRSAGDDRAYRGRDLESMAKTDKGEVMTYGYDLEVLDVALEKVENAARDMVRNHKVEDWFAYRLGLVSGDASSIRDLIRTMKGGNT